MYKIFTIKEAIEKVMEKCNKLQKESGLSDDQVEILYAIADAKPMYKRGGNGDMYVRSTKVAAIENMMKVLKIECDFDDIENLMVAKSTIDILKQFKIYGDGAHLFSSVYAGETDLVDFEVQRERFVIINEYGNCSAFKLDEDITYLGYQKYDIYELVKDHPEVKELLS